MFKKYLAILVVALGAAPLFADVELQTSIADVFNRGTNELAGSITMTVNDDDFTNASTDEPIFIRVTPDHGSRLADTLVDQSLPVTDYRTNPIFLAMELQGGGTAFSISADPETVSIVRWVEGESAFWIRVQTDSTLWIQNVVTLATSDPSEDLRVSWQLGVSARQSAEDNGEKSNLPFNTRNALTVGDEEDATSTLLCVNLENSDLTTSGDESRLQYDIISFNHDAEIDSDDGEYSGQAGDDTGINFTNDFYIARGKDRSCTLTSDNVKGGDSRTYLCVDAAQGNTGQISGLVGATNAIEFTIRCESGGSLLDTDLFDGAYVYFENNTTSPYGFLPGGASFGAVDGEGNFTSDFGLGHSDTVAGHFTTHGADLWDTIHLTWTGGTEDLSSMTLQAQVTVWYYYSDPEVTAVLDWGVVLVSHDGSRDEAPFDGDDQFRRCEPSEIVLEGDPWTFTTFVPCEGNPAVLFFPYVPKLVGTDFWAGLSYVNQGGVAFGDDNIVLYFYNEDGDLFTAALPGLGMHAQMTWGLGESDNGVGLTGAGDNNADYVDGNAVFPEAADGATPDEDFGVTRMSMFLVGYFEAEFLNDVDLGDLDGYLLIGSGTNVDGAYLPRNLDGDVTHRDLPWYNPGE